MDILPTVKHCYVCNTDKAEQDFNKNRSKRDGLTDECRACLKVLRKARYEKDKESILAKNAEYPLTNISAVKAQQKKRHERKRGVLNAARKQRRLANREGGREKTRVRGKTLERRVASHIAKPITTERKRAKRANRRARRLAASGTHSSTDIKKQYESQQGRCWWCMREVNDAYHVDHRIPLSRGGSNGPENIVVSCVACNLSKSNKLPHEFAGRLF